MNLLSWIQRQVCILVLTPKTKTIKIISIASFIIIISTMFYIGDSYVMSLEQPAKSLTAFGLGIIACCIWNVLCIVTRIVTRLIMVSGRI